MDVSIFCKKKQKMVNQQSLTSDKASLKESVSEDLTFSIQKSHPFSKKSTGQLKRIVQGNRLSAKCTSFIQHPKRGENPQKIKLLWKQSQQSTNNTQKGGSSYIQSQFGRPERIKGGEFRKSSSTYQSVKQFDIDQISRVKKFSNQDKIKEIK